MKLTTLESKGNKLKFELNDASIAFANALRKAILTEVPCFAIDSIDIYENSSVMFDEYIAHRLGQISLHCSKTKKGDKEVVFTLEGEGPKTIYSKDLKSSDSKIKPVYDTVPIIKLNDKQRIRLEAKAIMGKGKDHAKWQVCMVHYVMKPEIKIDMKKVKDAKAVMEVCPQHVLKVTGGKLVISNSNNCSECKECIKIAGEDAIKVDHSEKDFIFTVDSFGNMKTKEILKEALESLHEKVEEFEKELK